MRYITPCQLLGTILICILLGGALGYYQSNNLTSTFIGVLFGAVTGIGVILINEYVR